MSWIARLWIGRCRALGAFLPLSVLGPPSALVAAQGQQRSTTANVTAVEHVSVIPMDRERVLVDQTVLVRGDRIVALGPAAQVAVPAGATLIDGRGKFVIPGLADMHSHILPFSERLTGMRLWRIFHSSLDSTVFGDSGAVAMAERTLFLDVANGVTTIRDMHGFPETLGLRDSIARGALIGPRMYVATRAISPGYSVQQFLDYAKREILPRAARGTGYDFIKAYWIDGPILDSVAAIARRTGARIAGHAPSPGGVARAIVVGYASIEHTDAYKDLVDMPPDDTAFAGALRKRAAELRRGGVWVCPTLVVLGGLNGVLSGDSIFRSIRATHVRYFRDTVVKAARDIDLPRPGPPPVEVDRRVIRVISGLQHEGVGLLLGTDVTSIAPATPSGLHGTIDGFAVHEELYAFVRAGLTPYEALATGTRNVATFLGTLDSTGTVAVGKRADLVLLRANPLTDIRNTTAIDGVFLAGRWFSRGELDQRLQALDGTLGALPN